MLRKIYNDPFLRFLTVAGTLYLSWYLVYEVWLHPWKQLDLLVINNLIWIASGFLRILGYDLIPPPPDASDIRTIGIDGTPGLWVGDPCNGLTLFALFAIFVIAYPGPIKKKLWYIPLGLLAIHFLNALRVMALTIIVNVDYAYLDFNHSYTFTVIVYGFVFLLWYVWADRLSGFRMRRVNSKQ